MSRFSGKESRREGSLQGRDFGRFSQTAGKSISQSIKPMYQQKRLTAYLAVDA
ncbi:MAG: hypothetical protein LBS61_02830 [Endomicrobium sp.]|nr:hypothetical protein [Endomicrobium sp.]